MVKQDLSIYSEKKQAPASISDFIQGLTAPGHMELRQRGGGEFLGAMAEFVKRRGMRAAPTNLPGDQVTFGGEDVVALTMRDMEDMAVGIAIGGILCYIRDLKSRANQARGLETWPMWNGDPGKMPMPAGYAIEPHESQLGFSWTVYARNSEDKQALSHPYTNESYFDTERAAIHAAWDIAYGRELILVDHTRQPVEFDGNTLVPYQGVLHRIVGESIMGKVILDPYVDGADKGTGDLKTCWPEEISFSRVARHILEFPA